MTKPFTARRSSIRAKLLAGSFAAIFLSAAASYLLLARVVERQLLERMRTDSMRLAENTALQTAPLIAFENTDEMRRLLGLARANPDFVYAAIAGEDRQILAQINGDRLPPRERGRTGARIDGDILRIATPVVDRGKTWGYFYIGLSLERLHLAMARIRGFALAIMLALSAAALFGLQFLLQIVIVRPMERLRTATGELAAGGYPAPLAVHSRDEIGELIEQFNHMVDELRALADIKQRALEHLEESAANALAASRMKSEFLANMSHEIRTPLNGVLGMTSLLLDTALDETQRDFAETARSSADLLLQIVNDILDFSKIEAGKLTFDDADFDLINTLEMTVGMVADRAHQKGLEIAILVEEDVPAVLRGDAGRLRQVLLNIAGNAVKFTETGEVVVYVSCAGETVSHVGITIAVRDTGIGIAEAVQPRLFKPFTQADGSMTRRYGGTGLGLAISKQLVELMGGSISLESKSGAGSTFTFTVWLRRPEVKTLPPEPPPADLEGVRLLVVDDNETNRRIVRHYAQSWGMLVDEAAAAPSALQMLRDDGAADPKHDIAVIDAQMPVMDGYSLARAIRDDPAIAVRVVLLTSLISQPGRAELTEMGILQALTKPVRKRQLYDCLAQAMNEAAPRPSSAPKRPAARPAGKAHILVVEDNMVNQKVSLLMLAKLGYSAEVASNGKEALRALAGGAFDAILMDCHMPEMDGYQATREIRRRESEPRIPIIAMTAGAMQGDEEKCLTSGMDDYVAKPVKQADLAAVLEHWLNARQTSRRA